MSLDTAVQLAPTPPRAAAPRHLFRWVCTSNPFYALSAALFLVGLWATFGGQDQTVQAWGLMSGLGGYTLLLAMSGNLAVAPATKARGLPYKVPDDFTPIGLILEAPHGLFVGHNSRFRTAQELLSAARTQKLTFASTGTGAAALGLALLAGTLPLTQVVGLAFAVAASTFCPLLVLGIWWRGLTATGATAGRMGRNPGRPGSDDLDVSLSTRSDRDRGDAEPRAAVPAPNEPIFARRSTSPRRANPSAGGTFGISV